ncbi:hypothetical protein MRB53_027936 [Persea americana]|uniref:Uncharacterized protein n=1 Tax=Persea americana TaxID=3435 RepID=A0ACC2KE45_PERAE|nr:hypothetical protein MRB53_027936 [Persea americana]|eukprot:TRINITY_DN5157_c0_g3_i2.p1 TRINITY_DN5157_c0_g3~~TRINITY_DN5157_c0_g3_i2.p1  ORF type:complete len:633 (+),score=169.42 TRINITY_DN5157_c0_g3_i2:517-2415(+)
MEGLVGSGFDVANAVRKKRSNTARRPRPDTLTFLYNRDYSPSSSTPPSSDENAGYNSGYQRKEINLNSSASRPSSFNKAGVETFPGEFRKNDGVFREVDGFYRRNSTSRGGSSTRHEQPRNSSDFKRCSEGVLAPASWKSTSTTKDGFESQVRNSSSNDGNGRNGDNRSSGQSGCISSGMGDRGDSSLHEHKLRKVKLKVGGVTHTIHAKSTSESATGGHYVKSSHSSDVSRQCQKPVLQDSSDKERSPPDEMRDLQGAPWKDFPGGKATHKSKKDSRGRISEGSMPEKHGYEPSSEPVRKSKRVPKRRMLDGAFDDAGKDDEIRYLERLKTAKSSADYGSEFGDNGEERNKIQKTSKISRRKMPGGEHDDVDVAEYGLSRTSKDGKKKSRLGRGSEDTDYIEEDEDEIGSDGGFEAKRKNQRREFVDTIMDGKKEISLTMRQRALQSGKDVSSGSNASLIEFPNGLPPAPPRKQKEKPSEVEQQLKKAEAAQRRRMQNEKAALESQKEAIRKILGQDSSRKKREDKLQKRRDELAQEKAANGMTLASNTTRWVSGPNGTYIMYPKDADLGSIFDDWKPRSYPPPREKCAGPTCTNPYKYRDSKSNLPLCSLQCYRAVNQIPQPGPAEVSHL